MDIILTGLQFNICLVYLDDIIVYSNTISEQVERLRIVFQRVREAGLKFKPEQCAFFQQSVKFLGQVVVSDKGIGTDLKKIQAVIEWPVPKCVKEIRSFVGLASYYSRFFKHYAKLQRRLMTY